MTYTTTEAARLIGVTPGRLRQIAQSGRAGKRTIEGWQFSDSDISALRERNMTRWEPLYVRDFLTLSANEARLIVAALQGHIRTPEVSARDELMLSILDSVGPVAEGDRLDEMHNVSDWRSLIVRIAALTDPQCEMVMDAVKQFWAEDLEHGTDELLGVVGLI